jgi:hypothetical protein
MYANKTKPGVLTSHAMCLCVVVEKEVPVVVVLVERVSDDVVVRESRLLVGWAAVRNRSRLSWVAVEATTTTFQSVAKNDNDTARTPASIDVGVYVC